MKTIYTCIFALLISFSTLSAQSFIVDGLKYSLLTANNVEVISNLYSGAINIPSTVNYNSITYNVTSIGKEAFAYRKLTSVIIPSSVTSVGSWAFASCSGLTSITLPSSLISIGKFAFLDSSILTLSSIPSSVTIIEEGAFDGCKFLINVDTENLNYSSQNGVLYNKTKTILIQCPSSITGRFTIPISVTSIWNMAFEYCSGLTTINIPSSVTNIGSWAFASCTGLTSITIPSSVTSIGNNAFNYCLFTSIFIPLSVTFIGSSAFDHNCLVTVDSGNLNYSSLNGVLYNKTKTVLIQYPSFLTGSFIIPSSVTLIGDSAFCDCSGLTSVTIPSSVTSIGDFAFNHCSGLTSVTIASSVTSIGDFAFYSCSGLTSITIPFSVTLIGNSSFSNTALTSVIIPSSVTSIGNYAFSYCTALTSVAIPSSVTTIGSGAFENCKALASVDIPSSVKSIEYRTFRLCTKMTSVTIPSSVKSIGDEAFLGTSLISLAIPSSVTSIGSAAFQGCYHLTTVNIPKSVAFIGITAFQGCNELNVETENPNYSSQDGVLYNKMKTQLIQSPFSKKVSFIIPSSVTSIGDYAFLSCIYLTSISIPVLAISIGENAFENCRGLTSISIPASVTSIGNQAFWGCSGLTSIYVNSATPVNFSSSAGVFYDVNKTTCTLYVPIGSKVAYQAANQWKDFTNIVEFATAVPQVNTLNTSIYPNPFNDFIKIKGIECNAILSIYNLQGNEMLNRSISDNEIVPVSSLPKGLYLIKIKSSEREYVTKLVKE